MGPLTNQVLGIVFVVVATVTTVLMFYLWGFRFDKERRRSDAPPHLMLLHRILGYVFGAIYLFLMWQMVPRMWRYQIELPARTVAHLVLGMAIGALLFVKVIVVRFFKHLEGTLAPALGTLLFVASVLLIGLAIPFSLRESLLRREALRGAAFTSERMERVRTLLPLAGITDPDEVARLSSPEGLVSGRRILMSKCVQCHDLRTVLARPRTPDSWRQTVRRMAERSTVLSPITEMDQQEVTAYLIAISPTLQRTVELQRRLRQAAAASQQAVMAASDMPVAYDPIAAEQLFRTRCSQCHDPFRVAQRPPGSAEEAAQLVARMVGNGLFGTEEELAQIIRYITQTFVPAPD